ncbi:hypothetical protein HID58_070214 [Brassica napus]|uniref:RNase H type-1 domain-containing protein n=1 Tax=Brassica napus TaxID=3708 RepID=A0ABQ7YY51_BRANA|nr:hypothetical protein HID58_070214 [Brassica napus]
MFIIELLVNKCTAASCVSNSLEESDIWYAVNEDHQKENLPLEPTAPLQDRWKAPPLRYIKCNVGTAWNESSMMCGASWITRDAQGVPLHHSRRAFPSSVSNREADLQALLWAIEAMDNMKQRNVIFETSSVEVRDVLLNVCHFPELKYLTDHLHRLLQAVGQAAAATVEAPAPSPTSDAAMFVPALFASVVALASGLLF